MSTLLGLFEEYLGRKPFWARRLSFQDYFGIRHRKFSEQLSVMLAESEERVTVNRKTREISINFGGDTNQANQFAKTVPGFVLKGRFADAVRLDLDAIEKEMGIEVAQKRDFGSACWDEADRASSFYGARHRDFSRPRFSKNES